MKHVTEDIAISVRECERLTRVRILAVEGPGKSLIMPKPESRIEKGDSVIALGDFLLLKKLIKILSGEDYGRFMRRL